jgi:dienelactone hydrolase
MSGRQVLVLLCLPVLAQTQQTPANVSRKALDLLLAAKYGELTSLLNDAARERLTPEFLKDRVGAEIKGFGKQGNIGSPIIARDGRNTLVSIPVSFSLTGVNVQFSIDESMRVAGIYLRPTDAPLPPLRKQPVYSSSGAFHEREVTVGTDPWKLGGTLLTPNGKGPFPAIVLVHGPGPNDRDESIYSSRIFRDLAEGLASKGIAVLRYDKRTKVYGAKMSEMEYTVEQETIADALCAVVLLRAQPGVNPARVFLLGHSLGGYLAPRIAARDGKLAGLVFLAANARPIEDVALEQNAYVVRLMGTPSPEAQKRLDSLKAEVAKVKKLEPGKPNPPVVMGLPAAYLLDLKKYDAPAQARQISAPLLVLQGGRDFQVTMTDYGLWRSALAGSANVTFHSYPALNHLFISGDAKGTPAEYRVPGNVAPEVISDIAAWILK